MDFHQTEAHAQYLESIGWRVIPHTYENTKTFYFVRQIPLLPIAFLKIQRISSNLIDWKFVAELEKKYHIYKTVIETDHYDGSSDICDELIVSHGYFPGNDFMLTTKTRIIDIQKSQKELMADFKPKTRYNVRKAEKLWEVSIKPLDEVTKNAPLMEEYYALLRANAKRISMLLLPQSWLFKQWQAFSHQGFVVEARDTITKTLVSVAFFYEATDAVFYNLNGSTIEGRKGFAPSLLVWEGMIEARLKGFYRFDFDGVLDERYAKKQKRFGGFSRFKSGFGGIEVYYPPLYKKWRWPF